ncbi:MAG: hypothetical protein ACTH31_08925 [Pseudoclavibacter sp.]
MTALAPGLIGPDVDVRADVASISLLHDLTGDPFEVYGDAITKETRTPAAGRTETIEVTQ